MEMSKSSQNNLLTIFENFSKASEVSGNVKTLENFQMRRFTKLFYNIPIPDTCGQKIRFKNFDL